MVNLLNYDDRLVRQCVSEFVEAKFPASEFSFACIYRSPQHPSERQVFLVAIEGQKFALKLDLMSDETGRLAKEYEVLSRLYPFFEPHERVAVIKPIYLSPDGRFFVTEYAGDRTATDAIYDLEQDNRAGQIYRRAGEWLHVCHSFSGVRRARFWYQWMFESLEEAVASGDCQARPEIYQPMIDQLHRDASVVDGIEDSCVFSTGDFHGHNLIISAGQACGLDFTEVCEKLAVYDIVDFLKVDIRRDGAASEVDRSGILKRNKAMFFKLYRHPINPDVLDFCLRARLLIDWLSISAERYVNSSYNRRSFDRLEQRLAIAFRQGLAR